MTMVPLGSNFMMGSTSGLAVQAPTLAPHRSPTQMLTPSGSRSTELVEPQLLPSCSRAHPSMVVYGLGMWFVGAVSAWPATTIGRPVMAAMTIADTERRSFFRDMVSHPRWVGSLGEGDNGGDGDARARCAARYHVRLPVRESPPTLRSGAPTRPCWSRRPAVGRPSGDERDESNYAPDSCCTPDPCRARSRGGSRTRPVRPQHGLHRSPDLGGNPRSHRGR